MNEQDKNSPLVRVKGLARYFDVSPPWLNRVFEGVPKQVVRAVDGIDFDIQRGQTFSLVGESGCGKSTVARLVVGLYQPTRGEIEFDGMSLGHLKTRTSVPEIQRRMQMIFQDPYASLNPRWRVRNIIAEPIVAQRTLDGKQAVDKRVDELLEQVGLAAADGDKFPHEFSGGQRQRISIARALAGEPEFMVCDEPTSALDVSVQAQILESHEAPSRGLQSNLPVYQSRPSSRLPCIYDGWRDVSGSPCRVGTHPTTVRQSTASVYTHVVGCDSRS